MLDQLEGRFINSFIAVYEEKNISRAAIRLGYVQSTVTTHIKILEKILNAKLFHRLPRETIPTVTGERFISYAYQFKYLTQLLKDDLSDENQAKGRIQLMMQESFFLTYMPSFNRYFNKGFPKIDLITQAGFYQDILNGILNFSVDFGIVPINPERNDICFYPLFTEEMVFVTSPKIADKINLQGFKALKSETLISNGNYCIYDHTAKSILKEYEITYSQSLELPSLGMIKTMLLTDSGFSLLPKKAIIKELNDSELVQISFKKKIKFIQGLICHKNREHSYISNLFKENLIDYFHPE